MRKNRLDSLYIQPAHSFTSTACSITHFVEWPPVLPCEGLANKAEDCIINDCRLISNSA